MGKMGRVSRRSIACSLEGRGAVGEETFNMYSFIDDLIPFGLIPMAPFRWRDMDTPCPHFAQRFGTIILALY
jgi:hypothetical protein